MHESLPIRVSLLLASLTAVALLVLAVPAVQAQQQALPNVVQLETEEEEVRRYAVEVIVFEYAGAAAGTTELFEPEPVPEAPLYPGEGALPEDGPLVFSDRPLPPDPAETLPVAIDPADDEELMLEPGEEPPFVLLPGEVLEEIPTYENAGIEFIDPSEYQLTGAWDTLTRLGAYRPLMHTAWIQPTVDQASTKALPLRRIGDPPLRLNGEFTLYLSRFLHLVVDLSLEQPSPANPSADGERVRYFGDNQSQASLSFGPSFDPPATIFRINEDRIVRNNETRYFDHPKFGVIARITRVEETLPEDPDTTDDLLPGSLIQ